MLEKQGCAIGMGVADAYNPRTEAGSQGIYRECPFVVDDKSQLIKVAKRDAIAPGSSIVVELDGEPVAIFNVEGTFYAVTNRCPHAAGPLNHGFIEDGCVICPWHGWIFPLSPDCGARDGLGRYRVVIDGDDVLLDMAEL